ncbi:hypothetical protein CTI12_AA447300 [Artemisia annua]|uniref:Sugar phosphate transporter domain-containing protein n=1 Tax=Artemisia annua TaxID=35608 RepID=A0A2U1LV12_ARTAN|nr:hypothetical protein CTI12_AA447300 [Artemisia annua]
MSFGTKNQFQLKYLVNDDLYDAAGKIHANSARIAHKQLYIFKFISFFYSQFSNSIQANMFDHQSHHSRFHHVLVQLSLVRPVHELSTRMQILHPKWVLGIAKGAVAVVVSILIFRNPVSVIGMAGYSLTVIGVVLYGEVKKRSAKCFNINI